MFKNACSIKVCSFLVLKFFVSLNFEFFSYIIGDPQEALAIQQRAVLMSERVNGIDHPYTITEYSHLALYCFANGQVSTALKLLYRSRYLATILCGEYHPDIALMDVSIFLLQIQIN